MKQRLDTAEEEEGKGCVVIYFAESFAGRISEYACLSGLESTQEVQRFEDTARES